MWLVEPPRAGRHEAEIWTVKASQGDSSHDLCSRRHHQTILNLVDEIHRLLWDAYGDAVIPNLAGKNAPWEAHDQGDQDDDAT
jgi:hypothetical protein